MDLLQRHIFFRVAGTCLAAVALFTFVLLLGNVLKDLLGFVLAGQIPIGTFLQLVLLLIPYAGAFALPMGVLTGVLLVLGRMSAENEVVALRAAGLGFRYLSWPVLLVGLAGATFAFGVNAYYAPQARTAYLRLKTDLAARQPLEFIVPRTFIREFTGVVVYVGEKEGERLRDLWIWRLDPQRRVRQFLRAAAGHLDYDAAAQTLHLRLERASIENRDPENPENLTAPPELGSFSETALELPLDAVFGPRTYRQKLAWLTWDELRTEQARLESLAPPGEDPRREPEWMRVSVALHNKAATALAVLVFALVGIPLGVKVSRKETSANLGVALALLMGYYFGTVAVGWLDKNPALRPDLWLWLPNAICLLIGLALYRRIR